MQNPSMKMCQICGQSAAQDAPHCLRCGNFFPASPPVPMGLPLPPEAMRPPESNVLPLADRCLDLPPAVRADPGPGASPPWQQPSPTTPSLPMNPPPAWQPPVQPPPRPPWEGGPPPPPQQPWEGGPQPPPPPWEGGPQPPPPQQPWKQSADQLSRFGQSLVGGNPGSRVVQGDRTTIALCAIFLGAFGIHKFMLGLKTQGLMLLLGTVLTCGAGIFITGLVGIVEGCLYFSKTDADFQATYVLGTKEWF